MAAMNPFLSKLWEALVMAAGMFWQVGWSLVLGFAISGAVQTLVSNRRMRELLGRDGPKEIALATVFGAASSSCSYASAAVTRSMFAKGAALVPSLAFLFSSTNLVVELGIVLWLLMAWQFTLAEWAGGIVLIAIMTLLVKLTYPRRLVEAARERATHAAAGMDHDMTVEGATWLAKIRDPQFPIILAQHFAMDWEMLWFDLVLGFVIAGFLTAFVPGNVWHVLFLGDAPGWAATIGGALIGPLIAIVTFVCSIGNVPMAAVLWAGGIGFSGVLAFLYADLLVLPLLDVYRKYYGLKMTAYIAAIFYVTMALSAIVMDVVFTALHLVPQRKPHIEAMLTHFSLDYTFWLNLVFGGFAAWLVYLNWRNPMDHGHHHDHEHEHEHEHDHDHEMSASPVEHDAHEGASA
jgi:uncharacterized membrane protein YraQ (UPF0718 family)